MEAKNGMKYKLYDYLSVLRDPFMLLFYAIPLFAAVMLKIIVALASRLLMQYLSFDLTPYYIYIQAMVLMLSPMMLGTGTAFMMLDEMDGGLLPYLRVMPGSLRSYITRRFAVPIIATAIYIPACFMITMFHSISVIQLGMLTLLGVLQAVLFSAFIFFIAKDKVTGMAMAKASGLLMLPSLAPLLSDKWTIGLSSLTPFYYVTKLSMPYPSFLTILAAFIVNLIWLLVFSYFMIKRIKSNN